MTVYMVPPPAAGRVFSGQHRVRLADVSPQGRMRLDGIARHLQDVAADDSRDSALEGSEYWVVRRTAMAVYGFPSYQQCLHISTWCGGLGSHWAERRTRLSDDDTGETLVDTATLWVKVDPSSMRPARVGAQFLGLYAEATGGRTVSAKLMHREPTSDAGCDWPLRFADFDALGHVNNAVGWEPVEEVLADRAELRPRLDTPLLVEVEHRAAIERGARLSLVVDDTLHDTFDDTPGGIAGVDLWLVDREGPTPTAVLSATVRVGQPASS